MNEVTRIHLGRQPFTISVEAHQALKAYLAEIKKQLGGKSGGVIEEVELRMAELLTERGIAGDKVVLDSDVAFLKEQLGAPKDFVEDDDDTAQPAETDQSTKRLFRDTEKGMVAGVAAGLANYFGVEVLLVRLLFVVAILSGGWGIILYILLWLMVPEAKTSSERLQMKGVAVTVDSLKDMIDRADVEGAAERANKTVGPFFDTSFKIVSKIVGIGFVLTGLSLLFSIVFVKVYMAVYDGRLFQENLFPIGNSEHLLVNLILVLAGIAALFIVLAGTAAFRQKWPLNGWATGVLVTVFIVVLGAGTALAAEAAPKVLDRYEAATHTTTRSLRPFSRVTIEGDGIVVLYRHSEGYSVNLRDFDNPDLTTLKTTVNNGELRIDSRQFDGSRKCDMLCLFPNYGMLVTVYAPETVEKDYVDYKPNWQSWSD